jgi:hypothetical protein
MEAELEVEVEVVIVMIVAWGKCRGWSVEAWTVDSRYRTRLWW